jgi:glycosyltransferase involved in cell wall biosynthesis
MNFERTVAVANAVELTVLMPCLNEAETIATCVSKAMGFLQRAGICGEVLIADNGSSDGSQEIARSLGARVVDVRERGYGAALIGGIEAALGRYVIMGDADDSYDFSRLEPFVEQLRGGADLVMGNRFRGGIAPGAMPLLHKYLGNPVLSFLGRLFFDIPIGDFHCGLRGFRADAVRALDLQATGMEFASEMILRAKRANFDIHEVPTTLSQDGRSRAPHLRTWRDGWRHLKLLLMYSPRWLFNVPGLALVAIGTFVSAGLFFAPLEVGAVELDLNVFIAACMAVVVGFQVLTFGALAQIYSARSGFLPMTARIEALMRRTSVDRVVLIAVVLAAAGLALLLTALDLWRSVNFGQLDNRFVPRLMIAGTSILVIACQLFFSGFLLGILDIPRKRNT